MGYSPSKVVSITSDDGNPSLSLPIPKQASLTFGQQVAKLSGQPSIYPLSESLSTASQKDAVGIKELHENFVESKGKAVSPTFKPHNSKDGDWM